jgi:hypothetical protein
MDKCQWFCTGWIFGVLLCTPIILAPGCGNEQAQRQHWQDCAGVYHEACRDADNFQACEYEYYKECINVKPTS